MSIFSALLSLRSFSILAFLATAGFLGYELYQIWLAHKRTQTPEMPEFGAFTPLDLSDLNIPPPSSHTASKPAKIPQNTLILVSVLAVLLLMFGMVALVSGTRQTTQPQADVEITPTKAVLAAVTPAERAVTLVPTSIPTKLPTPSPTDIVPTETPTDTPSPTSAMISPTTVDRLPKTGIGMYFNGGIAVAAVLLTLAFLF